MKNTSKPRKLTLAKTTLRALTATDMQDVAGGISAHCTLTVYTVTCAACSSICTLPSIYIECQER